MGVWVVFEEFVLLIIVDKVGALRTSEGLGEASGDPDLVADPMVDLLDIGIDVG